MVVVDLTMWPVGEQKNARSLGRIEISNIGGTVYQGDYEANLYDKNNNLYKTVFIDYFPRLELSAFDLLYRVLKEAVGERNAQY